MKMRAISLLVLTLVVATAPAALAAHCLRCRPDRQTCVTASNYGFELCNWDSEGMCYGENFCGAHLAAAPVALASEYQVASVERLDEQEPKTDEVLVASNDTKR